MSAKTKKKKSRSSKSASHATTNRARPKASARNTRFKWPAISIILLASTVCLVFLRNNDPPPPSEETTTLIEPDQNPKTKTATPDFPLPSDPIKHVAALLDASKTPEEIIHSLKEESIEIANRVLSEFGRQPETLLLFGYAYNLQGNSAEAESCWLEVVQTKPDHWDARYQLAALAMQRDNYDTAIQHLRKATTIEPTQSRAWHKLALAFMAVARYDEALETLESSQRHDPKSAMTQFLLGQYFFQKKDFNNAKVSYERAIRLSPDMTNAYYGLSSVCLRMRLKDQANTHLSKFRLLKSKETKSVEVLTDQYDDIISQRASLAVICIMAADLYSNSRSTEKSNFYLHSASLLDTGNAISRGRLANYYQSIGQDEKALAFYLQLREIEPNEPTYCLNIALVHARAKRMELAETYFRQAIDIDPTNPSGYADLALLLLTTGRGFQVALELSEKAVQLDPTPKNLSILSRAQFTNGDLDASIASIDKAIAQQPDNYSYIQTRVKLNAQKGNSK